VSCQYRLGWGQDHAEIISLAIPVIVTNGATWCFHLPITA